MSSIVQATISSDALTSAINTVADTNILDPTTGKQYVSVSDYVSKRLSSILMDVQTLHPSSTINSLKATLNSAQSAYNAAIAPIAPLGVDFSLTSTNLSTVSIASTPATATATVTLAFINPGYSGTVTFSMIPAAGNALLGVSGWTVSFSPTTRTSAGTTTVSLSVPSLGILYVPGVYNFIVIGTDGSGLSNSCQISMVLTV